MNIAEIVAYQRANAARNKERQTKVKGRSKAFYASLPWKRLRYKILALNAEKNGGVARCELCGKSHAPGAPLNVDHIEPISRNWERRLDENNLQVLCGNCNHGKLAGPTRDFR
jgi:5-methylcytosine-specific restriction protein A